MNHEKIQQAKALAAFDDALARLAKPRLTENQDFRVSTDAGPKQFSSITDHSARFTFRFYTDFEVWIDEFSEVYVSEMDDPRLLTEDICRILTSSVRIARKARKGHLEVFDEDGTWLQLSMAQFPPKKYGWAIGETIYAPLYQRMGSPGES